MRRSWHLFQPEYDVEGWSPCVMTKYMTALGGRGYQPLYPLTPQRVGPKRNEEASDKTRTPTGERNQPSTQDPLTDDPEYRCEVCDRPFRSRRRLAATCEAPIQSNLMTATPEDVKPRWSREEWNMMARCEAQLILDGSPQFMSMELHVTFPYRTIEAIKGQRRQPDYKKAVQLFVSELRNAPPPPPTPQAKTTNNR